MSKNEKRKQAISIIKETRTVIQENNNMVPENMLEACEQIDKTPAMVYDE